MNVSVIRSIIFICLAMAIFWWFSTDRKKVSGWFVLVAVGLQIVFAIALLRFPLIQDALLYVNKAVQVLESVTLKATQFMFGYLAGGEAPFAITNANANFIVAFRVLPLILFISALSAVLFRLGVLPFIINLFARLVSRLFRLSGVLSFAASASIFLGTIEAPLIIKPYLKKMSAAELLALVCCSMATIAGTVMVLYATVLEQVIPGAVSHMITASLMSIPAALLFAHLWMPTAVQLHPEQYKYQPESSGILEALVQGIVDGLQMVLQIVAVIIVLFAFVYLGDHILQIFNSEWSIEGIFGGLLRPLLWLMGIPWAESGVASDLMASKIILNEFVAYLKFGQVAGDLSENSRTLMTYAMCGFANFASAGIILGGLAVIIPERRALLARITMMSLLIGNIATMTTAAVVNLII